MTILQYNIEVWRRYAVRDSDEIQPGDVLYTNHTPRQFRVIYCFSFEQHFSWLQGDDIPPRGEGEKTECVWVETLSGDTNSQYRRIVLSEWNVGPKPAVNAALLFRKEMFALMARADQTLPQD